MTDNRICIKYEGGDADHHAVEMRTLASSLLGFERIISDGLILFGNGRTPKRGERHELTVKVREPEAGSSITLLIFRLQQALSRSGGGFYRLEPDT